MFAALILQAMARELAEKGIERGVPPRDRGVASRLGVDPDSPELAAAERYLVLEDYIRPSSPDHKDGPFIITEFGWNDLGYELRRKGGTGNLFGKGCLGPREGEKRTVGVGTHRGLNGAVQVKSSYRDDSDERGRGTTVNKDSPPLHLVLAWDDYRAGPEQ